MDGHLDIVQTPDGAVLVRVHYRRVSLMLFVVGMAHMAAALAFYRNYAWLLGAGLTLGSFPLLFRETLLLVEGRSCAFRQRTGWLGASEPWTFPRNELSLILEKDEGTDGSFTLKLRTGDEELRLLTRKGLQDSREVAGRVSAALRLWVEERVT